MLFVEALAGVLLGLIALWLVLRPLVNPSAARSAPVFESVDPEETPKGVALAALKEIEFDRETGKLSDTDYEMLKAKYTAEAIEALRAGNREELVPPDRSDSHPLPAAVTCFVCGPRPEPDALFCSTCGRPLFRRVAA